MRHRRRLTAACCVGVLLTSFYARPATAASNEKATDLHPFRTSTKSPRFGYINHLGSIIIPAKFDEAFQFHGGLAPVRIGTRWGSIDETGKVVVPASYDAPLRFSDGVAPVRLSRNMCEFFEYVDRSGKTVIPVQPGARAANFSNGLAYVLSSKKFGYINRNGDLAIRAQSTWEDWGDYSEGLAPVKINGNWGFINNQGRLVIPAKYQPPITYTLGFGCFAGQEVSDPVMFSEKLAAVGFGGKAGYIDWSGKFVIEPRFDSALPFSDGIARVKINGKWGYIGRTGKIIIAPQFDKAGDFSEGLAAVMVKELWGFIDKDGEFTISPQFRFVREFQAGLAEAQASRSKWIYINKQGRRIWDSPAQD